MQAHIAIAFTIPTFPSRPCLCPLMLRGACIRFLRTPVSPLFWPNGASQDAHISALTDPIFQKLSKRSDKMDWFDLIKSMLISLFSAFLFWFLTFKYSATDAVFSSKLERSNSAYGLPYHRYRIRVTNLGLRDLMEVSLVVRLKIKQKNYDCITQLAIGNQGFIPVLRHYPLLPHKTDKRQSCMYTMTIYPSEATKRELSKRIYTQRIQKLAKKGRISLDDIFDAYGDRASIQVYLYGNDRTTGARQLFLSPLYTKEDICEGRFIRSRDIKFFFLSSRKIKKQKIFQIDPGDI